ncbi:hypothetical protein TeGR_g13305 [Tetraparma gracilis]|uniref:Protein farnesyltransferase subunit beta n=1 Tax=Tetraparma gracilis TaxID=2962635 RepID=A0ABQ6M5Q5_9STRA|nr:hypothetical protein TeGR_g13305 [Tetraparma gracilis]
MPSGRAKVVVETQTTQLQAGAEDEVAPFFINLSALTSSQLSNLRSVGLVSEHGTAVRLLRAKHVAYLLTGLGSLSQGYVSLDSSRPWIAYWCLHSLDLLRSLPTLSGEPESPCGAPVPPDLPERVLATLSSFQNPGGGFGGGPGQISHCAPTYASCLSLLLLGPAHPSCYAAVNRGALYRWFLSMKTPQGGFRMHDDGEVDVRGTYTVVAIASLLNVLTPELRDGVAEWVARCQTYEGGFGGEPGNEAHGGYAFCAAAALRLLGRLGDADVGKLKGWIARRQLGFEGGFAGRANKLVDGCYTFWQGGAMAVVNMDEQGLPPTASGVTEQVLEVGGGDDGVDVSEVQEATPSAGNLTFDQGLLQRYTLLCGQHVDGGLRDKPSKMRDYYHSCYNLSGLSVSQHTLSEDGKPVVYGDPSNVVAPTHPCYNIRADRVEAALEYYKDAVSDHASLMKE